MKKYFITIFLMFFWLFLLWFPMANADDSPKQGVIVFNEVLPGSQDSASKEFIELYNYSNDEVSLEGWSLQYASGSSLSWRNISINSMSDGNVPARGFYILSTENYLLDKSSAIFSATLAQNSGQLRLVDADGIVQDVISYGSNATMPLVSPAAAPKAGQSISRKIKNNTAINSQNNFEDFEVTNNPSPLAKNIFDEAQGAENQHSEPPASTTDLPVGEINQDQLPGITSTGSAQIPLLPLKISEILPNPASPATDDNDEFVELYNPNSSTIDLAGYTIVAGNSDNYKFSLKSGSIAGNSYATFYSRDDSITLSNIGGRVKLLTPNNSVSAQTSAYQAAPEGQSWVLASGGWAWTTTPTPNSANILTKPTDKKSVLSSSTSKNSSSKIPAGPYAKIEISELLPNPPSPQTDAEDEFVELHNPNKNSVNLTGYKLATGLKGNYKYTFKSGSIPAGGYLALFSRDSNLTLSNTAGVAKLYTPDGAGIDATGQYDKAKDGSAWIYANGKWQWTIVPTPGKPNIFKMPGDSKSSAFSTITNRDSAVNGPGASDQYSSKAASKNRISQPWIIAAIGTAALVYACYEYRHDVANLFYRFRRHRETRRVLG